jgi:hypothetical protein
MKRARGTFVLGAREATGRGARGALGKGAREAKRKGAIGKL